MSPASSGSLEVEKYIGACLISSQHTRNKNNTYYHHHQHHQHQHQQQYNGNYITYRHNNCAGNSDGWAGGMPLISFANHQQHRRSSRRHAATEELAVHTQGLPLIVTGRNQDNNHNNYRPKVVNPKKHLTFNETYHQSRGVPKKIGECKDNNHGGVDTLSVASDESSGSNNSETSLPRIIKPRKRRKKDRKPHQHQHQHQHSHPQHTDIKYFSEYEFSEKLIVNSDCNNDSPQLHHRFEDVLANLEIEFDDKELELSNCQCRYCDPAGQIWDVDKHCYSPFLTVPPQLRKQLSLSTDSDSSTSSRLSSALQSQCSISSTFSLDLDDSLEVGTSNIKSHHQQCLQISTQIVTSPNGHRDLEITLFSSEKLNQFKDSEPEE